MIENSTESHFIFFNPNNSNARILFADPDDDNVGGILYNHATDVMDLRVNDATRLSINSSGNVGIGTTAPFLKLQVGEDVGIGVMNDALGDFIGATGLAFRPSNRSYVGGAIVGKQVGTYGVDLLFGTKAAGGMQITERMRITNGGNVGIGTTGPGYKLDVNGSARLGSITAGDSVIVSTPSTGTVTIGQTNKGSGGHVLNLMTGGWSNDKINLGSGSTNYVTITGGNVGIGTTSPGSPLHIKSAGVAYNQGIAIEASASTNKGYICYDGSATYVQSNSSSAGVYLTNGGNSWTGFSDIRLKKNISTIPNALERITKLRGVNFNWKDDPDNRTQLGVVAQEAEEIFPELVNTDAKGYKGVTYDKIGPILIEAVKEQQKKIEEQESRLQKQEKDIEHLKQELIGSTAMQLESHKIIQDQASQLER